MTTAERVFLTDTPEAELIGQGGRPGEICSLSWVACVGCGVVVKSRYSLVEKLRKAGWDRRMISVPAEAGPPYGYTGGGWTCRACCKAQDTGQAALL